MRDDTDRSTLTRRHLLRGAAIGGTAALAHRATRTEAAPAPPRTRAAPRAQGRKITFALSIDDLPRVEPLLAEYGAQSGVEVVAAAFPYADLFNELNVNLMLETCQFDVVSLDDPWMPLFAGGGFLTDLEALMESEGIDLDLAAFVPAILALGRAPEVPGLRAVPWIGNVQVFAWRADVLAAMGRGRAETWDDVVTIASAIKAAPPVPGLFGIGVRGQTGNSAATTFLPILRGYGTDIFDETWEPQLATAPAQAAIATLRTLVTLSPPGVEAVGHEELSRELYTGQIAQAADIWPTQLLQAYNPALSSVVGKVSVGAQPAQPGVKPASITGCWLLGIPAGCGENWRAALDFINWLTAPAQQQRLLLQQGLPATRSSVLQDEANVERLPFLPGLLEAAQAAVPRPRTLFYAQVEEILGRWVADAIAGGISGQEALTQANAELRALMVRQGVLEE